MRREEIIEKIKDQDTDNLNWEVIIPRFEEDTELLKMILRTQISGEIREQVSSLVFPKKLTAKYIIEDKKFILEGNNEIEIDDVDPFLSSQAELEIKTLEQLGIKEVKVELNRVYHIQYEGSLVEEETELDNINTSAIQTKKSGDYRMLSPNISKTFFKQ